MMRRIYRHGRFVGVVILAALLIGAAARADDAELQRTWEASRVYLPSSRPAGFRNAGVDDIENKLEPDTRPAAVIVYAHGCSGLNRITETTGRFLAQAGYVVVAPDSFARTDKPKSCDPATHRGGLHRAVLGWRQDEIRYALEQVSQIPSINDLPVLIMGHSQGAITVATIEDVPVTARIVEGWTCHAGWPEYRGLNSYPDQPVLALVGADDPWFRSPVLSGDCGAFMETGNGSQSIVYSKPDYLAGKHWLSADRDVQKKIIEFIERSLTNRRKNDAG